MAYVVSLLPILACPLMMGLMMWLMMRGNKDQSAAHARQPDITPANKPAPGVWSSLLSRFHLCLNWKVVVALGAIGVGIWAIAPGLLWAAVPVLVVLACPLSMLFMMRSMSGGQCATDTVQEQHAAYAGANDQRRANLRAQHAAIAHEIAELETTDKVIVADARTSDVQVPERS